MEEFTMVQYKIIPDTIEIDPYPFWTPSSEENIKLSDEHFNDDNLTVEERKALNLYTNEKHFHLFKQAESREISLVMSALSKLPSINESENPKLFRGSGMRRNIYESMIAKNIYEHSNFISFSKSKKTALGFTGQTNEERISVLFVVKSPKIPKSIGQYSNYTSEEEYLYPRTQKFTIKEVKHKESIVKVYLEELESVEAL